jgi:hypothetical protein
MMMMILTLFNDAVTTPGVIYCRIKWGDKMVSIQEFGKRQSSLI